MSQITLAEQTTPATPSSGTAAIYPKADGRFYSLDDAGQETQLGGGGVTSLTAAPGVAVSASTGAITISGTGESTDFDHGTVSTGTITPDPSDSYTHKVVNNGAFTIAATSESGRLLLLITNGASAGSVTFSGFDKQIAGDLMETTPGNIYAVYIWSVNGKQFYQIRSIFVSPSISFRTSAASSSDLTTYTFSSQNIGTAAESRHVIVSVSSLADGLGSTSISSITIGGVAATVVVSQASGDGGFAGLAIAAVPTGTTADVVVTMSNLQGRMAVGIWAAYDLASATPVDTAASTADPASLNVDVQAGDVLVAAIYNNTNATATWTGATERFDDLVEGAEYSGADYTATADETPRTVECDYTSVSRNVGVCAVWR